jgi:hypothetical protein
METEISTPRPAEENKQADPNRPQATTAQPEAPRVEVSAATVTRMMGIASSTDVKLLEGRIDLLASKLSQISAKVERIVSVLKSAPSCSDIDRLEIQIGSIKAMVREVLEAVGDGAAAGNEEKGAAKEQSRKLRQGIRTSDSESE